MQLDFLQKQNLEDIIYALLPIAENVSYGIDGMQLHCDHAIVGEALEAAIDSAGFHKDEHRHTVAREVGHFCYWIMRLKPFFLAPIPPAHRRFIALFRPGSTYVAPLPPKNRVQRENTLNELVAVHYVLSTIEGIEREWITERERQHKLKPTSANDLRARLDRRFNKLREFRPLLADSFREHTYSARATAMVFELACSVELL
jgi:hypothetical protein